MNRAKKYDNGILKPGDVFEKYRVEKLLGKGGMGAVYLVRHNVLDSLFALKVLFPDVASKNKQFIDRFIREARLACKIKHPNLITVHDAGKNSKTGMYYIIMDYASGGSVRDLLKIVGHISPKQAMSIIQQMASALEVAQKYNMVHRDIKPDNIMFTSDGIAKLADLGIAKSMNEQDTILTLETSVFGTPAYMSPEQAMDSRKVDCRADIYSLGIAFYEMLSGQRPYRGDNTIEILSQVVRDEDISDIRTFMPSIPADLAELLNQMCAKNIQKRIQSPSELLKRLGKIVLTTEEDAYPDKTVSFVKNELTLPIMHPQENNNPPRTEPADCPAIPTIKKCPDPIGICPSKLSKAITQSLDSPEVTMQTLIRQNSIEESNPDMIPCVSGKQKSEAAPAESEKGKTLDVTIPTVKSVEQRSGDSLGASASSHVSSATDIQTFPNVLEHKSSSGISYSTKAPSSFIHLNKKFFLIIACIFFFSVIVLIGGIFLFRSGENSLSDPSRFLPEKTPLTILSTQKNAPSKESRPGEKNSPVTPSASTPSESPFDPLKKNTFVLLGGATEQLKSLKKEYIKRNGEGSISFFEAQNFSQYRKQLSSIIEHTPQFVLLAPAGRYAELGISRSSFDMLILNEANMLLDKGIPFAFVMEMPKNSAKIQEFNNSIRELCNLKSFTLIDASEDNPESLYAKILKHSSIR